MFKIIKGDHMDMGFVRKKFFIWWVKWSFSKTNTCSSYEGVYHIIKNGHFEFLGGEYANYFFIIDEGYYTVEYCKNEEDFKMIHAEEFI
jgi:hypothetical protein